MLEILVYLFPTSIAIFMHNYFDKSDKKTIDYILLTAMYTVFINLGVMFIISTYADSSFTLSDNVYRLAFAFKYLACAIIMAVIIPTFLMYIKKNFNFDISFRKINNEKKRSKK